MLLVNVCIVLYRLLGRLFSNKGVLSNIYPWRTFLSGRSIREEGWASIFFFFKKKLSPPVVSSQWISTYVLNGLLDRPIVMLAWPFELYWPLADFTRKPQHSTRLVSTVIGPDATSFPSHLASLFKKNKAGRSQSFLFFDGLVLYGSLAAVASTPPSSPLYIHNNAVNSDYTAMATPGKELWCLPNHIEALSCCSYPSCEQRVQNTYQKPSIFLSFSLTKS